MSHLTSYRAVPGTSPRPARRTLCFRSKTSVCHYGNCLKLRDMAESIPAKVFFQARWPSSTHQPAVLCSFHDPSPSPHLLITLLNPSNSRIKHPSGPWLHHATPHSMTNPTRRSSNYPSDLGEFNRPAAGPLPHQPSPAPGQGRSPTTEPMSGDNVFPTVRVFPLDPRCTTELTGLSGSGPIIPHKTLPASCRQDGADLDVHSLLCGRVVPVVVGAGWDLVALAREASGLLPA